MTLRADLAAYHREHTSRLTKGERRARVAIFLLIVAGNTLSSILDLAIGPVLALAVSVSAAALWLWET